MFDEILEKFEGSPSQQAVIRLFLERGFSVNEEGRVVSGGIEIPTPGSRASSTSTAASSTRRRTRYWPTPN